MKRCEEIEKENGLFIVIDVSEITVIIVVVLPFLCCCRERERESYSQGTQARSKE